MLNKLNKRMYLDEKVKEYLSKCKEFEEEFIELVYEYLRTYSWTEVKEDENRLNNLPGTSECKSIGKATSLHDLIYGYHIDCESEVMQKYISEFLPKYFDGSLSNKFLASNNTVFKYIVDNYIEEVKEMFKDEIKDMNDLDYSVCCLLEKYVINGTPYEDIGDVFEVIFILDTWLSEERNFNIKKLMK